MSSQIENHEPHTAHTWGEYYTGYYALPEIHEQLIKMRPFIDVCRRHFGGKRILEIGTGRGVLAVYFSLLGHEVTGLDYDRDIVRANKQLNAAYHGDARFVVGDLTRLPFPPGSFDGCYHQGLMEHFDAPTIVAALKAQVQTCGTVIFMVPTIRWRDGVFGDENMWPARYWLELMAPFRILDVFGTSYRGLAPRVLNAVGQRVLDRRPALLFRQLALFQAGQIGFAIARR